MNQYYEILDLKPGATIAQIKKAFRKKAKQFHPDKKRISSSSAEFIKIKEAYEYLIKNDHGSTSKSNAVDDELSKELAKNKNSSFDYENWLKEFSDDDSQSKLILYYSRKNKIKDAVDCLRKLNIQRKDFRIKSGIVREDFFVQGLNFCYDLVEQKYYSDASVLINYLLKMEFKSKYFNLLQNDLKCFAEKKKRLVS